MKKKYIARILAITIAAAFLLAGCGGGASNGSSAAPESTQTEDGSSAADESADQEKEETSADTEDKESDGSGQEENSGEDQSAGDGQGSWMISAPEDAPQIEGLTYQGTLKVDIAECFAGYYYEDGYRLIDIPKAGKFLLVPEGAAVPEGLSEDTRILQQPIDHAYLAATSAMSLLVALDATDMITMTGTDVSGWNIPEPKEAIESGAIVYAGKYSEPNYEMLIGGECDLAIESTMISHAPEVQEMIEDLGIPVLTDRSSFEPTGLGRVEWVKVYGMLAGKDAEAAEIFNRQKKIADDLENFQNTGKTIAYFHIASDGSAVIRRPNDYIAAMIDTAGGVYAFKDINSTGSTATIRITMEEFYSKAVDCDYLVYNSTIGGSLKNLDSLLSKSELFADFKAVKEGNVWQVNGAFYQSTDKTAELIRDLNLMLTGGDEKDMTFMSHVG